MELHDLINRDIVCSCGKIHRCDIECVNISEGALETLPKAVKGYKSILVVADRNTYSVCGERVHALIKDKISDILVFDCEGLLVPDEGAVGSVEEKLNEKTDLILGIGSGVINDICKYTSFSHSLKCGIIATAPSMDGYASSGAAMILGGMKITVTTHAPALIIGDVDILKEAPAEMIRSGYADIIGKYSALCDWRLSQEVNGEYLCRFVYSFVLDMTNRIRALAADIAARKEKAIEKLFEALIAIGVTLTLLSTTRPGSGSEHHLSHYFEITGLLEDKPYFLHGTDVGYSTIVTAKMREEIRAIDTPVFFSIPDGLREGCYRTIYGRISGEVAELQQSAGRYSNPLDSVYAEKWDKIREILSECPASDEITEMLTDCGFKMERFEEMYGREKIRRGEFFGKDLKDRYSVLWLYYSLFINEKTAREMI